MAWMITATVFLTEIIGALCFNINPVAWRTLEKDAAGFGYQIVQRNRDLLVSAPLEQHQSAERGQIFKCTTTDCNPLPLRTPDFAVNMSLGLTMTSDPATQNTLVCGPTIPKDCETITMYDGVCLEIGTSNAVLGSMPSSGKECQNQADITFLMDGSGSVNGPDFNEMKNFVMDICNALPRRLVKFAVVQFSDRFQIHSYLTTIDPSTLLQQMRQITQLGGYTHTATAIRRVVNEVFIESRGSRKNVKKILIVITDGQSNDPASLTNAVNLAQSKKIVRFAIGVGSAFSSRDAINELNKIASSPSSDHVFQVQSFNALQKIRQTLQDKIFSIEGSKTSGETVKREMSQGGFSAAYSPKGIMMSIVGANQWKGGFDRYTADYQFRNSYEPSFMASDSYLGYSMAVAKTMRGSLTIVGAPRYKHRGAVIAVQENNINQMIDPYPWQFQSGEYFGAEVCSMNLDRDSYTDLVLISAPMYNEDDREGRVYVCHLSGLSLDCHLDSPLLLRGAASNKGRFGSSLAVLPDLHRDNFNDLAVGAPLENDGTGSIYIFHGEGGIRGINPDFSQRITGSEVQSGLKFFGTSISKSSFDQSGDKLPDLAVGSKGKVVLLRSKPIVMVEAGVTYNPKQIPTQDATSDCSVPLRNTAQICFSMTKISEVNRAQASINFTLTLDATRKIPNNRAFIRDKVQEETGSINLDLVRPQCQDIVFFVKACTEDALNELRNELTFTFEGVPNGGLSPSLSQQAQTSAFYPLGFEINCGTDDKCVDDLKVDISFGKSSVVKVGIDELLDVTVTVTNRGEDSYNTRVILTYPAGLSYRKIAPQQGRIECNSLDSETGLSRGTTDCTINQPILRTGATAVVIISYGIDSNSQLNNNIFFTANVTSGNQDHSDSSELYARRDIDVKYSIFATIQSSLSYNNFSYGKNDLQKPVQQSILVANDVRALNFTVVIKVPVKLGEKDIWVDSSSFQIQECQREKDEEPKVTDFVEQIKKTKIVDCSVAKCGVFKCRTFMVGLEKKKYQISANLSSGWIEQIGLESAKFILTSTATLDYDKDQYIFISTGSNNNPPIRKIEAEVEVYPEPDFTKEIVGGSVGGLVLLALITAGLYKAGFFKSKYQQMMSDEAGEGGSPGGDEGAPPPE
ncbi:integrin alpha-M-like [Cheilinus undulatus]|uniref:integrin alpha-M-like n=1 Tax=Cheilinus undulatus TaxID=241271 RepID=UPI001BD573E7|nr:integrin alpha-M-like [Cheilinus undulatus]